jgi:hypothetical protein
MRKVPVQKTTFEQNKNHENEESPSISNVFILLHNGRRPLDDDKINMGQANFYLNRVGAPELFV